LEITRQQWREADIYGYLPLSAEDMDIVNVVGISIDEVSRKVSVNP
jgi:hypothetical protein